MSLEDPYMRDPVQRTERKRCECGGPAVSDVDGEKSCLKCGAVKRGNGKRYREFDQLRELAKADTPKKSRRLATAWRGEK